MPLDRAEKLRLLQLGTFGATQESLDEIGDKWIYQWVRAEAKKPRSSPSNLERTISARRANLAQPGWEPLVGEMDGQEFNVNELWRSYIQNGDQLRQRVAAALLEIFVVHARVASIGIGRNLRATASYADMLEELAFANFRDLLRGVALHPAMGYYLSHIGNRKAVYDDDGNAVRIPDENFAREILQLFSIGLYELNLDGTLKLDGNGAPVETYTQDDIFNLARVFTGWDLDPSVHPRDGLTRPMVADPDLHSPEEKRFLGLTIPAGIGPEESVERAIDHIFNHPNVGPFIGRQLIQRFVTSNPSPSYVAEVASAFNANNRGERGDMVTVIAAVLRGHDEATSVEVPAGLEGIRGKAREPMMRLAAVARYLGYETDDLPYPIASLISGASGIGQSPLKSPSVFNFFRPGYTPPDSPLADRGLVAPELQIMNGSQIISSINVVNQFIDRFWQQGGGGIRPELVAIAEEKGAAAIVDHATEFLIGGPLDPLYRSELIAIVEAVDATNPARAMVRSATVGVASAPEFLVQR